VLLHLQAGILVKAVGSAIAPPYLLCRSRAALWLAWAILAIASRPFGQDFFLTFLQRGLLEAMAEGDAEMFVDVAENPREDVITLPSAQRTSDATLSWADRVANEDSHMVNRAQAVYPAHLISEVNTFDGVKPDTILCEHTNSKRLRLFQLNTVPSRPSSSQPSSAQFTLHDNSVDLREIMDKIVGYGNKQENTMDGEEIPDDHDAEDSTTLQKL